MHPADHTIHSCKSRPALNSELSDKMLLRLPIADLIIRLQRADEVLIALNRDKRFTPWRILTKGWAFWRSPFVTSEEGEEINAIRARYFLEESEAHKAMEEYNTNKNPDLNHIVKTLAVVTVQLSFDLRQLLAKINK